MRYLGLEVKAGGGDGGMRWSVGLRDIVAEHELDKKTEFSR